MNHLNRINLQNVPYYLDAQGKDKTQITRVHPKTERKSIIVNHDIEKLNSSWYKWQQQSYLIQDAFPYLTPDEREFLITGITKEEWDAMFKDE